MYRARTFIFIAAKHASFAECIRFAGIIIFFFFFFFFCLIAASPAVAETLSLDCTVHDAKTGLQAAAVHVDIRDDPPYRSLTIFQGELRHSVTSFDVSPSKIEWGFYRREDNVVREFTIDRTSGAYAASIGPTTSNLRPSAAGVCKGASSRRRCSSHHETIFASIPALAQLVGGQPGQISNEHCRCKTLCEIGQSTFSQGKTIRERMRLRAKALLGCSAGEVRSTATRHEGLSKMNITEIQHGNPVGSRGSRNEARCAQ